MKKQRFIQTGLISDLGGDLNKIVVLNQPFEANGPNRSMRYFEDSKAIVVDRDPRDIYILAKEILRNEASFMLYVSVSDFISYHKLIRYHSASVHERDVLRLRFEDLVYNTEATINTINEFIGLSDLRPTLGKFNPEVSIHNTRLFDVHPEYSDDIARIEQELSEYIYPFESTYEHRDSIRPF